MNFLLGLLTSSAMADTGTITGNTSDAQVNSTSAVVGLTSTALDVGGDGATQCGVVYVFQIPPAYLTDTTQRFTAANFTVHLGTGSSMTINGDLYGLGYSTSPTVLASDYYEGPVDTANTLIQDNFLIPTSTGAVSNYTSTLVNYLNAQLALARADSASTAYVFFRISPDGFSSGNHYVINMADAGGSLAPTLSYTTAPISNWSPVPLGGNGYVLGLISDPSGAAIYCRTDVGGAFRWNSVTGSWTSISDTIISYATAGASNLMGVTSIAVDPNNPDNIYMACGEFVGASLTGIYASYDKGTTWRAINPSISANANGPGRTCGERMAVDPNNHNIVWYGGCASGLIKGVNSGGVWTWTTIPSTSVPIGTGNIGVTFVACDKNGGSTITYVGVYDSTGSTGGVYGTADDGATWTKIAGVALPMPNRGQVASNGTLYVTQNGTVASMLRGTSLATSNLSAITPVASINYVGLSVDTNDATGNTVYVAESSAGGAQFGKIWRTTTGGSSWTNQSTNFNGGNFTRMEPDGTLSCSGAWFASTSALLVNPTNSNELWASDIYGVARTQNAQLIGGTTGATEPMWYTLQKGQEETYVACLKTAPSGVARLMTGIDDVCGFRYLTTTQRPNSTNGNAQGNPSHGSSTSLDFCESNTAVWARVWDNSFLSGGSGGVSSDNGVTWNQFGEIANQNITNSGSAAIVSYDVGTYLAQQKAKGNNTVTLVLASGYSISPLYSGASINFDSKEGTTPPKLVVNGSTNLTPTADAYVDNAATTTNYGTAMNLAVSYKSISDPNTKWIYLKFDLTSISTITSAVLQLNRQGTTANTLQTNVGLYACTNTTWTEAGITWATKPGILSSSDDPISDPRFGSLMGGRIAVSSTNASSMVWLPEGTSNVPYYSNDRGVTWTVSTGGPTSQVLNRNNPGNIICQLASDRVNGTFYCAKFAGGGSGNHAIYSSTNGGATWTNVGTVAAGTSNVYRPQLMAAPAAGDVWVCDDGVSGTTAGGLWHSISGGTSWTKITGLTAVSQVAFGAPLSGSGPSYTVFMNGYKSGVKGVWRSTDYGSTWTNLGTPTLEGILWLEGDRQTYGTVYIGTGGRGIFQGQ